jgi:hypothetical protein
MSAQLVRKFKWFWDDADHAMERWLQDMARQGLHLKRVTCIRTVFVFERGEPQDVAYRVDFLVMRKDPEYVQLFEDAGWEHVDESLGWQYWRAPMVAGRAPEIFTDVESQITKYKRLLYLFAVCSLPMLLIVPDRRFLRGEKPVSLVIVLITAAVTVYAVVRLLKRIRRLREPMP